MMEYLKYHIFAIILVLLAISATASVATTALRFNETTSLREMLSRDAVSQRLDHFFATMNDFPGSAGKDILFLHSLSSVQSLHNTASRMMSPEVSDDFKNVLKNNGAYKDLFFYRKKWNCVMRVSSDERYDKSVCETPSPFITDILAKAAPLTLNEVYISPLLSYKDISPDGENIPVIVYVTPANTDCSIISVIDANYFLEEARRLTRDGELVFLLDKDGAYLANADRAKEKFSGDAGLPATAYRSKESVGGWQAGNFYRDFPDVSAGMLSDASARFLETNTKNFSFRRIYPTESNFAIYEGANKILGAKHKDRYFWVMVAVSDKPRSSIGWSDSSYAIAIATILVAHILVAWLAFATRRKEKI